MFQSLIGSNRNCNLILFISLSKCDVFQSLIGSNRNCNGMQLELPLNILMFQSLIGSNRNCNFGKFRINPVSYGVSIPNRE